MNRSAGNLSASGAAAHEAPTGFASARLNHHGVTGFTSSAPSRSANGARHDKASKTFASYVHFFCAGLLRRNQTGGIVPSQRFLIHKMIAPVPPGYSGTLVELGAGSGALTLQLAARCPKARILACEINPVLARDTRLHLDNAGFGRRVEVVPESAHHVLAALRARNAPVEYVLSGIPLGNLDRENALALIRAIWSTLAPGGMYIQFQHSLLDRKKIEDTFSKLVTVPALFNFPPAVVYRAHK